MENLMLLVLVKLSEDLSDADYLCFKDSLNIAFYKDIRMRMEKISKKFNTGRLAVNANFNAVEYLYIRSFIEYDFGLMADDKILAGALWRCFYDSQHDVDVVGLSKLVRYVRKQIRAMKRVPTDYVLEHGFTDWEDFSTKQPLQKRLKSQKIS